MYTYNKLKKHIINNDLILNVLILVRFEVQTNFPLLNIFEELIRCLIFLVENYFWFIL